jgi:hypothetical protein
MAGRTIPGAALGQGVSVTVMTARATGPQRRLAIALAIGVLSAFALLIAGLVQFLALTPPVRSPERDLRKAAEAYSPPARPAWTIAESRALPSGGRLLISGSVHGEPVLLVGELGTGPWLWSYLAPALGEGRPVAILDWPAPLNSPEDMILSVREALAALRGRGLQPSIVALGAGASAAAAAVARPAPLEAPLLARACSELLAGATPSGPAGAPLLVTACAELLAALEPSSVASPVTTLVLIAPLGPREWSGFQAALGRALSGSAERAAVSLDTAPGAWRLYQQNALRAGVVAPATADPFMEEARAAPVSFTPAFVDRYWRAPAREWATAPLERLPVAPLLIDLVYDQFVPPADTDRIATILAESGVGLANRITLESGHLAPIDWRWAELLAVIEDHLGTRD